MLKIMREHPTLPHNEQWSVRNPVSRGGSGSVSAWDLMGRLKLSCLAVQVLGMLVSVSC